MNVEKAVEDMRKSIENLDDKDYIPIFIKYKKLIINEIRENPKNTEAFCLLPIIFTELNYPDKNSINILDKCYRINGKEFTDREYAMWATDKAYIIGTGCFENKEQKFVHLLEEAQKRNSPFSETYFALGMYYFNKNRYEDSLDCFSKAWEISKKRKALYNAALCLIYMGKTKDAILFLEDLYNMVWSDKYEKSQMAFTLIKELLIIGEKEKALSIFSSVDEKKEYFAWESSEICYMLNDYNNFIDYYESENWYEEEYGFSLYIYSLIHSGNKERAEYKMWLTKEKILSNIKYIESLPLEEYETIEDRNDTISEEKNRLSLIENAYRNIVEKGFKPEIERGYTIMEGCYYINCPRHKNEL